MIEGVERVKNLGGFSNFEWDEEVENFEKMNVIFGENGSGKTSLSNIFRLFSEHCDNQKIWEKLKSENSEVQILYDGNTLSYQQGSWEDNIYVFNEHFINEHVYDGSKSNLSEFDSSVTTKEQLKNPEINELDEKIQGKSYKLNEIETLISRFETEFQDIKDELSNELNNEIKGTRFPSNVNLERVTEEPNFLENLESRSTLREKLNEQFSFYESSTNETDLDEDIAELNKTNLKNDFQIDLKEIKAKLDKSVEVDAEIEEKIDSLKKKIDSSDGLVTWFEKGYKLLKLKQDDRDKVRCRLCNSNLSKDRSKELIGGYRSFFNPEFKELKDGLEEKQDELRKIIDMIDKNRKSISKIRDVSDKRSDIIDEELQVRGNTELQDRLKGLLKEIESFTTEKFKDVTKQMEVSNFEGKIKRIEDNLEEYTELIKSIQENATRILKRLRELEGKNEEYKKKARGTVKKLTYAKLSSLSADDLDENLLTNPVDNFENNLDLIKAFYEEAEQLKAKIDSLEGKKKEKIAELKDESQHVNQLLKKLGIHHFIIDKKDGSNQNIEVQYESGEATDDLEYTLSSGEKTTLAFAYYLSKIKYEIEMNDKESLGNITVVIDDPVSSLDQNRLFSTANIIKDRFIGGENPSRLRVNQLFILSHNLQFLKFLNNIANVNASDREDYLISKRDSRIKLEELPDSLNAYQTEYFHKLIDIMNYVNGNYNYEEARKFLPNYVRNVMETFLSFKFARLKHGSSTDKYRAPSLGKLINKTQEFKEKGHLSSVLSEKNADGNVNEANFLKKLREIKSITDSGSHGNVQNATGFRWIPQDELEKLANDTLDMIEFLDEIHLKRVKKKMG